MSAKKNAVLLCLFLPLIIAYCSRNARNRVYLQDLEYALTVDDPAARLGAVLALREQKEAGISGLAKAARDSDEGVRKVAIKALGEVGGQEAVEALAELLKEPDQITRVRAIVALGKTGRVGFPCLVEALGTEPSPRGRMMAAGAISRLAERGDTSAIMERFDRQDTATQMHLVITLARIGDEQAYHALGRLIESPNRLVRFYVVNSLAEAPPHEMALPILTKSLGDEASEVRMWGIFGLERLNHPDSFSAVLAALGDEDAYVRKEAAYTLGILGNKEAVPFLVASLKDPTTMVRGDAATALGLIGGPEATAELRPLLEDPNASVQIKAAEALVRLGDYGGIDELIQWVDSPLKIYAMEAVRVLQWVSEKDFGYNKEAWLSWWASAEDALSGSGASSIPREED